MPVTIHPTAIVEPGAEFGEGVSIGALAWIGPRVRLGDRTSVGHHATVDGATTIGSDCEIHPYAYVGGKTQDLKYAGGHPELRIGDRNVIREFATFHCGTTEEHATIVGDDNHFLAYTHVAHECSVGNHCIFSNNATLAGHVTVADRVIVGGLSAIHQFCRIGRFAFLGGCAKVVQDIPPFMIGDGHPAETRSVNTIGLQRNGFSEDDIRAIRAAFKALFRGKTTRAQAIADLRGSPHRQSPYVEELIAFIESSERGIA